MIANPSPANRFRENPTWINQHREMIVSAPFMRAVDYALLEYQGILVRQNDTGNAAAATGFKLQGALELIQILRLISETPRPLPAIPVDQLNHKV